MTLAWGIIGCGDVAERKGGPALYGVEGSTLVAAMSRNGDKARDFAERHGAKRHYDRIDDLLADNELNAVYVATPPCLHAEQTIMAAEAGKHVLCEKPMAMNVEEGRRMIASCRSNGVQLMIAYYRRCFPAVVRFRELIDQGTIGQPVTALVRIAAGHPAPAQGGTEWRLNPAIAGGGHLVDVGSHAIDLLHYWLGDVMEVSAMVDTVAYESAVENSSSAILRFRNSVQAMLMVNRNVGYSRSEIEVGGTAGRLILTGGLACRGVEVETAGEGVVLDLPPPGITHSGIVADLLASVRDGRPNCVPGDEGLRTTQVLGAIYESSSRRCAVRLGGEESP